MSNAHKPSFFAKITLAIICILIINKLSAQTYNFNNYSLKDGLIQSNVNDILQDKDGYMWFATDGGLSKFNGQSFINYSTNEGLSEAAVNTICEDNKGQIWVGHSYGKLSVYDGTKFKPFDLELKEKPSRIADIIKDKKGNLWLSTVGGGAIYLNTSTGKYKQYSIAKNLSDLVFQSFIDQDEKVWFVTDIGIKYFDSQKDSFLFFKPEGFPYFDYTSIAQDNRGNLWFGTTAHGIVCYNLKSGTSKVVETKDKINSNFINSIIINKNHIYASAWEGGVIQLNQLDTTNIVTLTDKNGMPSNKVRSLFIDREQSLWMGMQDNGVTQFKGFRFIHFNNQNGLKNLIINAIVEDDNGNFWLGTNEGIDILSLDKNYSLKKIQHIDLNETLRNNLVTSLCKHKGKIYVATFKGDIGVFDSKTRASLPSLSINHTFINNLSVVGNELWIANNSGLTTYNFNTLEFKDILDLDKLIIAKVHPDKDGIVWIGTRQSGLWYAEKNKYRKFEGNINHNSATSFCNDLNGNLWIGTEGGGLYKKKGKNIVHYSVKNGLISDYITLLTTDTEGNLWVGTNMGLVKLDITKNVFFNYGSGEGFTSIETKNNASFADSHGAIWLGTVNGASVLRIKEEQKNAVKPIVYLMNYEVFSTQYQVSANPVFNHTQNEITFNFIGLSFRNAAKIQYTYMLEGLDDKWHVEYGINKVVFTHLPPGKYKFILKACSAEGLCADKPIEFAFEITPPIYKRTWFILLMIGLVVAVVLGYVTFRTRYLKNAKQVLEQQVHERTLEIEQKNQSLMDKNIEIITKNKEITDSINYAKRIQEAILPGTDAFRKLFPKAFILYHPKDIVSGDFYWFADINAKSKIQSDDNDIFVAVADCTGHGVPGAFMCMIGTALLNQIVQETNDFRPSNILENLHNGIRESLKQQENETRDGMDIALCHINRKKQQLEYAGALRSLLIFRGETYKQKFSINSKQMLLEEIRADKFPVGGLQSELKREFTNHVIDYYPGDTIYMFTDGYADQFGGPRGKKLMSKNFKEMITTIQHNNMYEQFKYIEKFMQDWKEGYDQVDDILVMGIRF